MHHTQLRTYQKPTRATAVVWREELDQQSRLTDLAMALLPASLILATATALLVVLI